MQTARKIGPRELRALVREAAFDDEGAPTGSAMGAVARTSETRLANAVSDALDEDQRFVDALEKLTAAAHMAIVGSDLIDASAVDEVTQQDFVDTFGADIVQAATNSIVSMIKSTRGRRNR